MLKDKENVTFMGKTLTPQDFSSNLWSETSINFGLNNYSRRSYLPEGYMSFDIFKKYERQFVEAGTAIFQEKDPADLMYVIIKGKVTISKQIMPGVEKTLSVLEEGEYFGEMSLLLNVSRSASATAIEDTELVGLKVDDFKKLWRDHPEVGMSMLIQLASRLEKTNKEAILMALELALAEHQNYSSATFPGEQIIVATGSFDVKNISGVLRRRKEVQWEPHTKVVISLIKPGQGQDALLYIIQTDDARETMKLTSCFKDLVQWTFSFAVSTNDEFLETLI